MVDGRESLGRSVEKVVQNVDGLDEELSVDVAVLDIPGFRNKYSIRIMIDIDVDEETFSFYPDVDSVNLATQKAIECLRDFYLEKVNAIPVFFGSPTLKQFHDQ